MSGFEAEQQAIETHLAVEWAAGTYPLIELIFANTDEKQPSGVASMALSILPGGSGQKSIGGSPIIRHVGLVQIDIFIPEGDGTREAGRLADAVALIFERQRLSTSGGTIVFGTVDRTPMPPKHGVYHTLVSFPFRRDRQTSP